MPRFEPFYGLRYDEDLAPAPEVIAPPYDVIDEQERAELAGRSPYNAIHVELPIDDPVHHLDRYANAAALFEKWEREGVLRRDDVATLYVYRMHFRDEAGHEHTTTGVIGALEMDVSGQGSVLPHEQTMPKPKGDRLDLLRATAVNTSPIWGLSLADGLAAACNGAVAGQHATTASDDTGVVHELIPVVDPAAIEAISALVASTPVVIADGHHRYETATFYRAEQHERLGPEPSGADLVMALIVELSEDELFVQAIHRLISGLPENVDLPAEFGEYFDVRPGPSDPGALAQSLVAESSLGLVTPTGNYFLCPKPVLLERAEADLDSSRLDVALGALPVHELVYQHGVSLAADAVSSGRAQAAVLLRPATIPQIADTAHSGRRMPPKTTFFYPKPRTGMVYRPAGSRD